MKNTILFSLALSMFLASCAGKTEHTDAHEGHDMTKQEETTTTEVTPASQATSGIIDSYLTVKDALVADDYAAASAKSADLVAALIAFENKDSEELKTLQAEALASAENLNTEDAAAQRESFQALSVTLTSLLKIAGTDRTLYQQHCPMYKNNTGGIWLSASEEIKNPLFGSKMLTCGKVQETLTSL